MGSWWIGTVSTLAGAIVGAILQSWRDRVTYRRQISTRWDDTLLRGIADYLTACDRSLRALIRWRQVGEAEAQAALAGDVTTTFEAVHEKSHVITLLTGDRSHPLRLGARRMREPLLRLWYEVQGGQHIDDARFETLVITHRDARDSLVEVAQSALGVHYGHNSTVVLKKSNRAGRELATIQCRLCLPEFDSIAYDDNESFYLYELDGASAATSTSSSWTTRQTAREPSHKIAAPAASQPNPGVICTHCHAADRRRPRSRSLRLRGNALS